MRPLVERTVCAVIRQQLHAFCQLAAACDGRPTAAAASAPSEAAGPPTVGVGHEAPTGSSTDEWATVHEAAVRYLSDSELPSYMVPSMVTFVKTLPVTANGKLDSLALEALATERRNSSHADEASTQWVPIGLTRLVASCWAIELGLSLGQLSATSDFGVLSGNSLTALRICQRLWHHHRRDDERSGVFGEHAGVFSPTRLLRTPILQDYVAMLAAAELAAAEAASSVHASEARHVPHAGPSHPTAVDGATVSADPLAAPPPEPYTIGAPPCPPPPEQSMMGALAIQAVRANALELLRLLLHREGDDLRGMADELLVEAVHRNHCGCAQLLLRHGAWPNATGCRGMPVLSRAVQHRDGELAHVLLTHGASVTAVDDNLQTAVHHAARTGGDARCIEMLLQQWESATGAGELPAETAATVAATAGDQGAGDQGAHGDAAAPNACDQLDCWGRTPLHWATTNGHRDAIVALIGAGGSIWLRDAQQMSSMDLAEQRAECREWLNGQEGHRCDKLTLSMLKLMAE